MSNENPVTSEQLVEWLKAFAAAHPGQYISRSFLTSNDPLYSWRQWNKHFGSFLDFKRAADLINDRGNPMSENEAEFKEDWEPEDCLEHLREFCRKRPKAVVSRNMFRVESGISESTWNRYFGSFLEYKRQAGIILSRHAHRLERDIAKHASVDNMRSVSHDKGDWEGTYLRPSDKRFQTALVLADIHDVDCDPFYRRVATDIARRVQPEKIVYNGDLFDLPEFSKHTQDPRDFALVERIQYVHGILRDMREAAPDAEQTLVEGNHEFRMLRHLSEQTMAVRTILSDLHGMTISSLLGLDAFQVNLVARADLGAWSERDITKQLRRNYLICWETVMFGHFPDMRNMGLPGASGHHHRHVVWQEYHPLRGPYEWHQTGCGHVREASYARGDAWANGFIMAHCDTVKKLVQFEYVDLSHDHAFVGGKLYMRDVDEARPEDGGQ